MPLKVWNGSTWVTKPLKVWNGTAWVVKPLKRWTGAAWAFVSGGTFPASASPTSASGSRFGPGPVATGVVTVTPGGGVGTITYAWSISNPAITIGAPSSSATDFTATVSAGQSINGTATCVATDSLGATATVNVPVTLADTA